MVDWSKHLKHENPDFSPTFQHVVKVLRTTLTVLCLMLVYSLSTHRAPSPAWMRCFVQSTCTPHASTSTEMAQVARDRSHTAQ